jgi:nitroimidazol reductase NimA-like FMN-containing flavoprotein (pyridoxamine 5'-phosphate oxidase superfamily)
MRKNALEKDALGFLKANSVAVLATCIDDIPHASSIYYDVDDNFNFYYITKRNTQKNIHIAFNPSVALVIGTGPERISVQVKGRAQILMREEKITAMHHVIARITQAEINELPMQVMDKFKGKPAVVFKIKPESLRFMNMDSKKFPKSISKNYHQII